MTTLLAFVLATAAATIGSWAAAEPKEIRLADSKGAYLGTLVGSQTANFTPTQAEHAGGQLGIFRLSSEPTAVQWRVGYVASGHLRPPVETLEPSGLLSEIQQRVDFQSTQDANFPVEEVIRWLVPPNYLKNEFALEWAIEIRFKGVPKTTANYSMRVLTRRGFVSFDAAVPVARMDELRLEGVTLREGLKIHQSRRHSAFDPSSEAWAPYSIRKLLRPSARVAGNPNHSGLSTRFAAFSIVTLLSTLAAIAIGYRTRPRRRA